MEADPERIQRVIVNFVNNAVKIYTNSKSITIQVDREPAHTRISVIDQGSAITLEKIPHLFDRYFHAEDMEGICGIGSGPLHSHRDYQKAWRHIGVDSELGQGGTFLVHVTAVLQRGKNIPV